ncbi:glycosyltransferase family 39 protein [Helicobacter muridarum]|uniref:Glycosyltransferase family 39 protein n=1 Tax=Helicobacter muridarum TaxID=216 RepID=A0A377PYX2_9HELI|nr:glycosyltransferase family 39 protein [Helicobacter muridarum]TLD99606.1 glycosyltransferase family 39 protein [Helicobacter muridarum]STQ86783.1 Undecaprenyl phosphate-alpha-4-amino-4-deoxy-L-arabinose arabinosyl transferase [Helicobacter muridarum]
MIKIKKSFTLFLLLLLIFIIAIRMASLDLYALMDTTEARYAEMSRKILETGNWITIYYDYGVPFWGKPPLSFWASALSMKFFGIDEFGARLAPFIASLLVGILLFAWSYSNNNEKKVKKFLYYLNYALGSCIIFFSSGLGFVASGAVMTDMFLLVCICLCMIGFWKCVFANSTNYSWLKTFWGYMFFVGLALGLLAKGPIIIVLTGLPIFAFCLFYFIDRIFRKDKVKLMNLRNLPYIWGTLLAICIALPWYILSEIATPGFLEYFIIGEHINRFLISGWEGDMYGNAHSSPLGMIWLFWVWAFLPWSLVFFYVVGYIFMRKAKKSNINEHNKILDLFASRQYGLVYLLCWILSPLIFFSLSKNTLEAYVLPSLPASSILLSILIFGISTKFSVRIWILPSVIIIVFSLFLIYPKLDSVATRHQKDIINLWDRKSNLIFLKDYPAYSAQFYSHGNFAFYKDIQELSNALIKESNVNHKTIVMPSYLYNENKDFFRNYNIIAQRDNKTIIKNFN